MTAILQHDASLFPSDWYLQTHSTNPLLSAATVTVAIDEFEHRVLHDVQRGVLITNGKHGLLECTAFHSRQKIIQFVFSSQVRVSPSRGSANRDPAGI